MSYQEARRREMDFFSSASPWNAESTRRDLKGRIGVPSLTRELSKLLSRLIQQTYVVYF